MRTGRIDLAEWAVELMQDRIEADHWPEYYDGKRGGLIGRRANFYQTWSATALIVAHEIFENPDNRALFERFTFQAATSDT